MDGDRSARALAVFLATAGISHFVVPAFYDAIVPRALPGPPRRWTQLSGVAELVCAAAVARRSTRRTGGALAAIVFVTVFPANVQMALDWRRRPARERTMAYVRLPLQAPLVAWALAVRRGSVRRSPSAPPAR
jgi:uncharacterized membrane protein